MKVLAMFSAVMAVAFSDPVVKTWSLQDAIYAVDKFNGDPAKIHEIMYLTYINQVMATALFHGFKSNLFKVLSPSGADNWTVAELEKVIADPETKPEYKMWLTQAYDNAEKNNEKSVSVGLLAMDLSAWTQSDLNKALKDNCTQAELIPYLEKASNELERARRRGTIRVPNFFDLPDSNMAESSEDDLRPWPAFNENDKIYIWTPIGLLSEFSVKNSNPAPKLFIKKTEKCL